MAKMAQQRMRRFRSVRDSIEIETLRRNYQLEPGSKWSNASISPGTKFMSKIKQKLYHYIKDPNKLAYWKQRCKSKNLEFVLDGPDVAGEGEHKILQYIKKFDFTVNDKIVIYGLDADLFFLALASKKPNIFLMRESDKFDSKIKTTDDGYQAIGFCSIDFVHDAILTLFMKQCSSLEITDPQD